jgi:hypothetical protein
MRGVIKSDENEQSLNIIGYLNWYVILFAAYLLIPTSMGAVPSWAPLLVLVVLMYVVQYYRFNKIAEVAFDWLKNNR